eukprot:FR736939.1.p2 GENE.FR736939.1~~FR736939.1.p2  ORF type:complete len:139 (-),score=15.76 FR736939.1:231-647(-)
MIKPTKPPTTKQMLPPMAHLADCIAAAVPESLIIIDGMNDTKPQRSANTDSARGASLPTSPGAASSRSIESIPRGFGSSCPDGVNSVASTADDGVEDSGSLVPNGPKASEAEGFGASEAEGSGSTNTEDSVMTLAVSP